MSVGGVMRAESKGIKKVTCLGKLREISPYIYYTFNVTDSL
jgi:hypothetical protein